MDFAFSEEQEMLRAQARSFLSDRFPADRVAELAHWDEGWERASWRQLAELGWLGLSAPEEAGGAGMSFLDEAIVFEELGRSLYPGPYFSTVGLALPAVAHSPDHLSKIAAGEAAATFAVAEPSGPFTLADADGVGTKAEQTNGTWALTGEKHLVPDLAAASLVAVVARAADGVGLWLVETSQAETQVLSTMDATRRLGRLALAGARATLLVEPAHAPPLLESTRRRALAALALEAVGVAQTALDLAVQHAKERQQFDKPIGTYQAVSHEVANIYMETELARSLAYWAAWCVAENDPQAPVAAAAAKAAAAEAAVTACERSIQVHGGVGFTWEHILHRYYKRAQWIDSFENYGRPQRAAVAAALLD